MNKLLLIISVSLLSIAHANVLQEHRSEREKVSKAINQIDSNNFARQVFEVKKKYQAIAKSQIEECEDSEKVGDQRNQCLMNLRNWQVDTEKKFFKIQREYLKDNYQRLIRDLNELEEETVKNVIKQFPASKKN